LLVDFELAPLQPQQKHVIHARVNQTQSSSLCAVQASGLDEDDLATAAQGTAGFSARDMGATASDAVLGIVRKCLENAPSTSIDVVRLCSTAFAAHLSLLYCNRA
jgi:hypothetical protein